MRALRVVVSCVVVGTMALGAAAQPPGQPKGEGRRPAPAGQPGQPPASPREPGQPGPGREALAPEKAKAAWELEATGVAKHLGAKDEQVKDVVKAYSEARTSHGAAMEKLRKEQMDKAEKARKEGGGDENSPGRGRGGMGPEAQKAMEDLNKTEREKLHKALGATLSAEQATKAIASLGTFNRGWDNMVDTIAGFKLDAGKQTTSLDAIETFVVEQAKARESAAGDREAMRTAMQDARKKLLDVMKKTLTEEQLTKFEAAMGGGRGPGGGPPARRGGGEDGGGGGGG